MTKLNYDPVQNRLCNRSNYHLKLSSNKMGSRHISVTMFGITWRWIGRGGSITWPPRSPDLTPLDFFLWGYAKNIVYQVKINDI
jgi:hypothetical protein